jgi:spore coat polysaccharide biosynthesis protein SpsF
MRSVCVVQARMGSTRLPGKVVLRLAGKPVLRHVLERCKLIPGIDEVVCAVADTAGNELLLDICAEADVVAFPGAEMDPLSRTFGAARDANADIVMRVTSDCPLIDPRVCGLVLTALKGRPEVGFASNVDPRRTYPQGLDCEALTMDALDVAHNYAFSSPDREHVTKYTRRFTPDKINVTSKVDHSRHRWTLDFPRDLQFLRALWEKGEPTDLEATLAIIAAHPELAHLPEPTVTP